MRSPPDRTRPNGARPDRNDPDRNGPAPPAEGPRDRGQAAVEFAVVLPLVVVMALGLLQLVVLGRDQVRLELVAREAARNASAALDPHRAAVTAAHAVEPGVDVDVAIHADVVSVTVRRPVRLVVPVLGALADGRELTSRAVMRLEPP